MNGHLVNCSSYTDLLEYGKGVNINHTHFFSFSLLKVMLVDNINNIFINETNNKHVFITGCLCLAGKETRTFQICLYISAYPCEIQYLERKAEECCWCLRTGCSGERSQEENNYRRVENNA